MDESVNVKSRFNVLANLLILPQLLITFYHLIKSM